METLILIGITGILIGGGSGFLFFRPNSKRIEEKARHDAEKLRKSASEEAEKLLNDARRIANQLRQQAEQEEIKSRQRLEHLQSQFDERISKREELLEQKIQKNEEAREKYEKTVEQYNVKRREIETGLEKQNAELERISKLSKDEAKKELFDRMEHEVSDKLTETLKRKVDMMRQSAEEEGSNIVIQSIQRLASSTTSESTTTVVKIDSEDIKGKIIGREGRNINAFEMLTGVDLIIDDTPGTVTIASFDMFRRYIAKIALENLIKDGRIHPSRIEESVQKAQESADKLILDIGKKSCEDLGIPVYPEPILKLLGRLRFRTSYGQNVLAHSMEVAYIAEGLAHQLGGADPEICKRAGLLHDIGKAVSHEVEGGHAVIGKEILEKFGVDKRVVIAMQSHHEDFPYESLEARILQAADAISASRPGARRETLEKYIKRLKELEAIASSFSGVEKVFAIQAGREVRVFVNAKELDDLKSEKLSFEIARKLEKECEYPGEVHVAVIRESRFEDVAK
ncbi:ribonuclease Y [Candidatus Gracilibacteria bacterium]|nr:ribonuclease Y [Candidatus Gracilibacteria bacterium]